jgi:TetR/AcrR family transcriptional regulator, cholesterol catabolism regulator
VGTKRHTKQDLLEAASRLFEQKGYKGTSIRDIAKATDTSISNIYHHFGSKEGVWKTIHETSVMDLPTRLRNAMAAETDPLLRFKSLLKAHLEVASEYRRESRIFFLDHYPNDLTRNQINVELQKSILGIYVDELTNLRRHGVVKTRHIKIMALNILGVLNWVLRWYRLDGKLKPKKVHEEIINFIVGGIGVSQ